MVLQVKLLLVLIMMCNRILTSLILLFLGKSGDTYDSCLSRKYEYAFVKALEKMPEGNVSC
jgi:hypothetical protein